MEENNNYGYAVACMQAHVCMHVYVRMHAAFVHLHACSICAHMLVYMCLHGKLILML